VNVTFHFFDCQKRYITSDCVAVDIIHDRQGYAKAPEDAVADVLQAGKLELHLYKYMFQKILIHIFSQINISPLFI